jgi:hypothetical protein
MSNYAPMTLRIKQIKDVPLRGTGSSHVARFVRERLRTPICADREEA